MNRVPQCPSLPFAADTSAMSTAQILGVVLVLIAAAVEALSNVIQHKATNSVQAGSGGETSAVLRTLKTPLFLLGFVLMIVGYAVPRCLAGPR